MGKPHSYFSVPITGGTITLQGGVVAVDFKKGVLRDGTNRYEMGGILDPGQSIRALHLRESGGTALDIWLEGYERKIRVQAYDDRDFLLPEFDKFYLQPTGSGCVIELQASTDPDAYFFSSAGLKKKLNQIMDGDAGTFTDSTDSLEDIRDAVDTVDGLFDSNQLFGVFGDRSPPLSQPLGSAYFVDGDNGSDSNDGTTWASAVATIDAGINLCSANSNDVVFVTHSTSGYDENAAATGITMDIAGVHLIGLGGSNVTLQNSHAAASACITISATNCEVAGFRFVEATNTVEGVLISSTHAWIHDNSFYAAMENAIHIQGGGQHCIIEYNWIGAGPTNDGIEISGVAFANLVRNNVIFGPGDNGININGDSADNNWLVDNYINGNGVTTTGINIALGDYNIVVGGAVVNCTTATANTGTGNKIHIPHLELAKKPEWSTPVTGTYTPAATGAPFTVFTVALANPATIAVEIDTSNAGAGESGVISVEKKVDGTNWQVIGNAEYDNTDFSTIDDGALVPSATKPKRAHQWVFYADSGTDIRMVINMGGAAAHTLYYNYNVKQEI